MKKQDDYARPYATYYYHGILDKDEDYAVMGCCATQESAEGRGVVGAYFHKYPKVIVYNRNTGTTVVTFIRVHDGVKEAWGHRTVDYLRRIK